MSGTFAGMLLKSGKLAPWRKAMVLAVLGLIMAGLGWLWNFDHPVIKKLWTSSMVLVSSGYCFMLMALFYYVIDVCHFRFGLNWLRVYGMNSIAAYMLTLCIQFRCIPHSLLYGLEPYIGSAWYLSGAGRLVQPPYLLDSLANVSCAAIFARVSFNETRGYALPFRRLTYKPKARTLSIARGSGFLGLSSKIKLSFGIVCRGRWPVQRFNVRSDESNDCQTFAVSGLQFRAWRGVPR